MFKNKNSEDHWMSISDLMSGLMIVFLFISIVYMLNIKNETVVLHDSKKELEKSHERLGKMNDKLQTYKEELERGQRRIKDIVVTFEKAQIQLYESLLQEFRDDLPRWGARIRKETLSIVFFEPEILFKSGESDISPRFKEILDDFFPRYISILSSEKFINSIAEIRIEGHTSSEWKTSDTDKDDAYFLNMNLSQERTLSVLRYCYNTINSDNQQFVRKYVTANGLSSSKLIYTKNGVEDKKRSRRVEFRTRTNAESKIVQILEEVTNDKTPKF